MPNINPLTFTYRDTVMDVLTVGTEELNRKLHFAKMAVIELSRK